MELDRLSDEDLLVLARNTPQAFDAFYRRHVHAVQGYFRRRVFEVETAFDLTAETFASVLRAVPRYEPVRSRRAHGCSASPATRSLRRCAVGGSRIVRGGRWRWSRSCSTRPMWQPWSCGRDPGHRGDGHAARRPARRGTRPSCRRRVLRRDRHPPGVLSKRGAPTRQPWAAHLEDPTGRRTLMPRETPSSGWAASCRRLPCGSSPPSPPSPRTDTGISDGGGAPSRRRSWRPLP